MIQKKICMLGAFSVGKTSLIQRYVNSIFDDKYLTTVGVKIVKKELVVNEKDVKLLIWDLAGQDDFTNVKASFLRGSSACIIVVDGTRPQTAQIALELIDLARKTVGDMKFIVALNKHDLHHEWELDEDHFRQVLCDDVPLIYTSAKTGDAVEQLFETIASNVLKPQSKAA